MIYTKEWPIPLSAAQERLVNNLCDQLPFDEGTCLVNNLSRCFAKRDVWRLINDAVQRCRIPKAPRPFYDKGFHYDDDGLFDDYDSEWEGPSGYDEWG